MVSFGFSVWFLQINNGDFYIEDSVNYPDVRTFVTGIETADGPIYDLISITRNWEEPTQGTGVSISFAFL